VQAPNLAAAISNVEMEINGIEFEKVDGTPLGVDNFMDTDTAARAKEQALWEMVHSRHPSLVLSILTGDSQDSRQC
jgi:hypothetical protein